MSARLRQRSVDVTTERGVRRSVALLRAFAVEQTEPRCLLRAAGAGLGPDGRGLTRPWRVGGSWTWAPARPSSPRRSPSAGRCYLGLDSDPASPTPPRLPRHRRRGRGRASGSAAVRLGRCDLLQQRARARAATRRASATSWCGSPGPAASWCSATPTGSRRGAGTRPRRTTTSAAGGRSAATPAATAGHRRTGSAPTCSGCRWPTASGGRAASRTPSCWTPGRATTRRWTRGLLRVPGPARGRDLEPAARPAPSMTAAAPPVAGGRVRHRSAGCASWRSPSAWSRWPSPSPRACRRRHQARPRRRPGPLPAPGPARLGPAHRLRPAAEPGLRLPVPDGAVLPAGPPGRGPGVGGAARLVGAGARGRLRRDAAADRRARRRHAGRPGWWRRSPSR